MSHSKRMNSWQRMIEERKDALPVQIVEHEQRWRRGRIRMGWRYKRTTVRCQWAAVLEWVEDVLGLKVAGRCKGAREQH